MNDQPSSAQGRAADPRHVRAYEGLCGPWYAGDDPADIAHDIRLVDPEAEVTQADAAAYLAERLFDGNGNRHDRSDRICHFHSPITPGPRWCRPCRAEVAAEFAGRGKAVR